LIEAWIDGLCEPVNPSGTACYGYIIKRDAKTVYKGYGVIGTGKDMTNNIGEYTALVKALEEIRSLELDWEKIIVRADSRIVAYGMGMDPSTSKPWKIKAPRVLPLYHRAKALTRDLDITFQWIPREDNEEADGLARLAYRSANHGDANEFKPRKWKKPEEEKYFRF
jgi:ribonuclease HI